MQQNYMVIGGEGFLGQNIARKLKNRNCNVISTFLEVQPVSDTDMYLNLGGDITSWNAPDNIDTAFICAAVTSIDQCHAHPEKSKIINVDNTISIASKLADNGTAIIFPSSNLVFDGLKSFCKVDDLICPITEYGRQKRETETGLLKLGENIAVARFTKIFGPEAPLVLNWIAQLKKKVVIHPFSDMALAPVSIDFAVNALIEIAHRKSYGVWHISAKEDISYEELARHLARRIGVGQEYVQPINAIDSGLSFESIPKYTTLDTSRLQRELGIDPPDTFDTIDALFGTYYENRR